MRRAKRAVLILATLVVLVLTGCKSSSPWVSSGTAPEPTASPIPAPPQKADLLDQMVGRWSVTYELASVKPASMRAEAKKAALTSWQCIVYDGQMTLQSSTMPYRGPIVVVGSPESKRWNFKGKAEFAGSGAELWTSDIVVDGKILSANSFSAKQTSTLTSNTRGKLYTATWNVKGSRSR